MHLQTTALTLLSAWDFTENSSIWIVIKGVHCYTGFRLACRYVAWSPACRFMVYSSQGPRCFSSSPSGIAPELNRSQLYAISRGGQSGKVIDLLARRCLPLGHPSAASGACAIEQISLKRQYGERQASLKAALHQMWKHESSWTNDLAKVTMLMHIQNSYAFPKGTMLLFFREIRMTNMSL